MIILRRKPWKTVSRFTRLSKWFTNIRQEIFQLSLGPDAWQRVGAKDPASLGNRLLVVSHSNKQHLSYGKELILVPWPIKPIVGFRDG